ncbi:O-antigen ligase family protein [Phenylobacterium sp.]|jgi:O-antigen ligase|uniref:O-antigen ligase family protein n=1 Tax=Phenylobacterium sp. TaxID=1871053 RepID=UPI00378437B3
MTSAAPRRDRLAAWCGWVMVGAAALTPLLAWFGPLGFAPLLALVGLLCLPALRAPRDDLPLLTVLSVGVAWAALSTVWSPHRPEAWEESMALKLVLQLLLYWAAVCGARRASPRTLGVAFNILAWSLAALGLMLIVEAFTGAALYRLVHEAVVEPIRPDLAARNLARSTFVLALLWPLAAAGVWRNGGPLWLAAPMALGTVVGAIAFDADAPAIAALLCVGTVLAVLRWPATAPLVIGVVAGVSFIVMPALVLLGATLSKVLTVSPALPLSWAMRLGYWRHAAALITQRPLQGWGLDSSRAFSPQIQLHPHNGPLQAWLELGALGALVLAAAWWLVLSRLSRPKAHLGAAAACGAAVTYLLFGLVNYGLWQEWWVALAALAGLLTVALVRPSGLRPST